MTHNLDGKGTALTPSQLEFLSEDEFVTIIPNFSQRPIQLLALQDPVPAFSPSVPVQVPLWLAIHLRKQDKCRIKPPDWMDAESLKRVLRVEKDDAQTFEPLPFHYVEIAEQLLLVASSDFPDAARLRTVLKDISDQRGLKVHDGLRHMDAETTAVKLNNLSGMEVNSVRDFLATGMDLFFKLKDADVDNSGTASTVSTARGLRS